MDRHLSAETEIGERLTLYQVDEGVRALIRHNADKVQAALPGVMDSFYDWVATVPSMAVFFRDPQHRPMPRRTSSNTGI